MADSYELLDPFSFQQQQFLFCLGKLQNEKISRDLVHMGACQPFLGHVEDVRLQMFRLVLIEIIDRSDINNRAGDEISDGMGPV